MSKTSRTARKMSNARKAKYFVLMEPVATTRKNASAIARRLKSDVPTIHAKTHLLTARLLTVVLLRSHLSAPMANVLLLQLKALVRKVALRWLFALNTNHSFAPMENAWETAASAEFRLPVPLRNLGDALILPALSLIHPVPP